LSCPGSKLRVRIRVRVSSPGSLGLLASELKFQSGIIPFIFLCQCIHSIPVQLLTSRSHSNSIPHHSNSIPVNSEVYTKLPNSSQFHQDKVHMEYITCHFQFHTINSHHTSYFLASPATFSLVAYLTFEPWLIRLHTSWQICLN